jgi:hypothetical protein
MKTILLFGVMAFAFVAVQGSAQAREKLRKNETYCLESYSGGDRGGGGSIRWCGYETMAQCQASKASQGDQCSLNPVLAFEQRNRRYHY